MFLKKTVFFSSIIGLIVIIATIMNTSCVRKKTIIIPENHSQSEILPHSQESLTQMVTPASPAPTAPEPTCVDLASSPTTSTSVTLTETAPQTPTEHPAPTPSATQPQPSSNAPTAKKRVQRSSQPVVICSLSGVLFTEDTNVIASKVGLSRVASYTLKHWKNPADKLFSVLEKMAREKNVPNQSSMMYQGYSMPYCFVELQLGLRTHAEVIGILNSYIDTLYAQSFFSGHEEYDLMKSIVQIILTPTEFVDISKPNTAMIEIVKKLKQNGCSVYVLTNVSTEIKEVLTRAHPAIFNLFDGVVTSSDMKMLKNNEQMFTHILNTTNAHPEQCILVDSEAEALDTAQRLGITTIKYSSTKDAKNKLKKHGMLA